MAMSKNENHGRLTTNDVKRTADRVAHPASLARHLVTSVEPGRTISRSANITNSFAGAPSPICASCAPPTTSFVAP
ncbi:hypothetical protein VDGL01_04134 [Verticillium dahliae]